MPRLKQGQRRRKRPPLTTTHSVEEIAEAIRGRTVTQAAMVLGAHPTQLSVWIHNRRVWDESFPAPERASFVGGERMWIPRSELLALLRDHTVPHASFILRTEPKHLYRRRKEMVRLGLLPRFDWLGPATRPAQRA